MLAKYYQLCFNQSSRLVNQGWIMPDRCRRPHDKASRQKSDDRISKRQVEGNSSAEQQLCGAALPFCMADDIIARILREDKVPAELTRRSSNQGMAVVDSLILGHRDDEIVSADWLRKLKPALEKAADFSCTAAKYSVLVPTGWFGLTRGMMAPDLDIRYLGIGRHRFFLFHSSIGLFILRKLYLEWLKSTEEASDYWVFRNARRKAAGALLGSFALGVGIHLAIDVFQPKAVIFPFIGSLVKGTLVDDRVWLMGNSLWAFQISHDIFSLVLAEEMDAAKAFASRYFDGMTSELLQTGR